MSGDNHQSGSRSLPIRAVILDYGEVLCFAPEPETMGRMAAIFRIEPEHFMERYVPTRGPYDQGLLTAEEYWRKFARDAGGEVDAAQIETLRTWDTRMWSRINAEMIEWARELRAAGVRTALLSNMQHDMAAHARRNFAWLSDFEHQILSCELRLIKPDPAIFEHTIQRLDVKPGEALLVDDREANVEAARTTGLQAIRFQSAEQLRGELRGMGFVVLPGMRNGYVGGRG
jgi:putative hydrolase of the HAD superfamily